MNVNCNLVGLIRKIDGQLNGIHIYSEPSPTMNFKYFPVVILQQSGKSYAEASVALVDAIRGPLWTWMRPFMSDELVKSVIRDV